MKIKKCKMKDHDPDRPLKEQKWCLYTNAGKLMGRHRNYEDAKGHYQAALARIREEEWHKGSLDKDAIVRKCRERDIDKNRSRDEQTFCLYSKDGKRLLGRHPDKESAYKQEYAIQKSKGARCLEAAITLIEKSAVSDFYNVRSSDDLVQYIENDPSEFYNILFNLARQHISTDGNRRRLYEKLFELIYDEYSHVVDRGLIDAAAWKLAEDFEEGMNEEQKEE